MSAESWGFTNDLERRNDALQFRDAAVADHWKIEPLYDHESVDSAAKLTREGFVCHVMNREHSPPCKYKYEVAISLWGPDGMVVIPPYVYSWEAIQKGLRHCHVCQADDRDTVRAGFATRVCGDCVVETRKRLEFPGWCD